MREFKLTKKFIVLFIIPFAIIFGADFLLGGVKQPYAWLGVFVVAYFTYMHINFKVVISEQDIRLRKRGVVEWNEIDRISRVNAVFYDIYTIFKQNKPVIRFPSTLENYQELLKEIMRRAPHAEFDGDVLKKIGY